MDTVFIPVESTNENEEPLSLEQESEREEITKITFSNGLTLGLLPSQQVLLTTVMVKTASRRELAAAIPYALEESLSEPVESLHFSWAEAGENSERPVAVVAKSIMERVVSEGGCNTVLPECLALPWQSGCWSIVLEGEKAIVRTGKYRGFSATLSQLEQHLELLQNGSTVEKIEIWSADEIPKLPLFDEILTERHPLPLGGLPELLENEVISPAGLNLLSGPYATRVQSATDMKSWIFPLLLLSLLFFIDAGLTWQQSSELESARKELALETEKTFKRAFPEVKRIVNLELQAEQRLKQLQGARSGTEEHAFTDIFSAVTGSLRQHVGVEFERIEWKKGKLELRTGASSLATVEQARESLIKQGLSMEVVSVEKKSQGVTLQLRFDEVKK